MRSDQAVNEDRFYSLITVKNNISKDDIKPLVCELGDEIPEGKGNNICKVTPKLVADWSNRIKTHIFKYRAEILGEGGGHNDKK